MAEETEKKESKARTPMASEIKPPKLGQRYKKGEKVKGTQPPHGGSWSYDKDNDELTLVEEPTQKD